MDGEYVGSSIVIAVGENVGAIIGFSKISIIIINSNAYRMHVYETQLQV